MGKTKFKINVKIPDGQHMAHFETALQIANGYRMQKGEPVISMERFCLNSIITGANQVIEFYRVEMERRRQEDAQQQQAVMENVEGTEEAKQPSEDTDS